MRRTLAPLIAAVLLCGASSSAWAEGDNLRIVDVTTTGGQVKVVVAGSTPSSPASAVTMTIGGRDVTAVTSAVTAAAVKRVAVLAIDTSGSTAGSGIVGARAAANAFLDAVPDDVLVGMVSFADKAQVVVAPTRSRGAVRTAINRLTAGGNTALYDAVRLALTTTGTSGVRSVVVLTDGKDDGSTATLADSTAAITASKATVDAVALVTSVTDLSALQQLARAGRGVVRSVGAGDQLAAAFRSSAKSIADQVVLTAPIPDFAFGTSATVTVHSGAASDSAFVVFPNKPSAGQSDGPRAVAVGTGWLTSRSTLVFAVAALFLGLLVVFVFGLTAATPTGQSGRVRRRLSLYTLAGRVEPAEQESTVLGETAFARSAVDLAGRIVSRRDLEGTLQRRLEAAAVPLRPAEWLLLHVGLAISLPLLLLIASAGRLALALLGLAVGIGAPLIFLVVKETRRTNAFLGMLPDTLQLISGSLSAGYSLPQALDIVVREGAPPVSTEFNRALVDARLGVPVDEALDNVATRMKSTDFGWVVMAIRIQQEVGGNLAEILSTVSETLRERERLRRQVKVLSAEGRLSAAILAGLPPLFALYLLLVRPDYIKPLYTDALGILMLVTAVVLLSVGVLWLRKVVKVEV
jgi:tight adherence protein B